MRILIVSQYFWPESFRINEAARDLVARGHDVTVLTAQPNYPDGAFYPDFVKNPDAYSTYGGARIVRVPITARGKTKLALLLNYLSFVVSGLTFGAWRLRKQPFDTILVCQLSPVTAALPALLQRWWKRAPLAMWVLDLWPETLEAVGVCRSKRALGWIGALVSFIYRRCDVLLVQARSFRPFVEKRCGRRQDIRYFPAWAEAAFETSDTAEAPAPELAPYRDTFNVLFAGNIGEAQDMPTVLEAAATLRDRPEIRWLIVGDGRGAEALRCGIKERGLEDRVVMLGRHPVERMPSFFAGAGALLVSLKPEPVFAMTIPGKVQSYMRSGKPIVGLLDGEGAKVIAASGAGLVAPAGNAAALAGAVGSLASMSAMERAQMGANARAYCQREFDRTTLFNTLESWLIELASAGHPARTRAVPIPASSPAGARNPAPVFADEQALDGGDW